MADAAKLKRKTNLGAPPPVNEASRNLHEPELILPPSSYLRTVDGRSRRRTNRTLQLNLRVTPQCDALIREIADQESLLLAEVLERALTMYKNKLSVS